MVREWLWNIGVLKISKRTRTDRSTRRAISVSVTLSITNVTWTAPWGRGGAHVSAVEILWTVVWAVCGPPVRFVTECELYDIGLCYQERPVGDKEQGCGGSYRPGRDCRMKYCHCVLDSFVHTSAFFFNYWCEGRGTATVANWTVFWSETLTSFITYFFTVNEQFYFHPLFLSWYMRVGLKVSLKCVHKGVPKNKIESDAEDYFLT